MSENRIFAVRYGFYYFPGYYYSADCFACCKYTSPNPD